MADIKNKEGVTEVGGLESGKQDSSNKKVKVVKTKKKGITRKFFKSFVNVRSWSSYDEVKANTSNVAGLFRRLFSRSDKEVRRETYEEAIARLGINEEQVISRKRNFLHSALVYYAFAAGFLTYFIYLFLNAKFLAAFLTAILVTLMLLTGYREHFWYMQMQKKKLGCGFKDWIEFILGRESR